MTAINEPMHKFGDCSFCTVCSKPGGDVLSHEEKAKHRRATYQYCVLPSVFSMLLESHGENKQRRFHYAMKISLFCICRTGIG